MAVTGEAIAMDVHPMALGGLLALVNGRMCRRFATAGARGRCGARLLAHGASNAHNKKKQQMKYFSGHAASQLAENNYLNLKLLEIVWVTLQSGEG